ncbi:MAG: SDR family NAD(P)-dependent oxidoreductase [Limimaricola sp.]|uniref:SDR family NAD(P)-dependent oxidoreductase n=1 Tax=Limimaricola sp. TaxID=2211665 RepID=UPI001D579F16|nr:SDR family oxidoreductase [Limimaricola sp.]MBI1416809.1 SDR family NAD(P)-dependent oxidoreductase [Limimaricola sp.]
MTPPVERQRVVVTGAAQGLGAAIARAFAGRGAEVILIDRAADPLQAVARQCGPRAHAVVADLSDAQQTREAIAKIQAAGPVDTLIHNAAILRPAPLESTDFVTFRATLDVGLQAAFLLSQAVWAEMKARGGTLIFVSSQSGIKGFADETAYCMAKHGLEGFSKCLAMEAGDADVVSCTITPGHLMHTPMSEANYTPENKRQWISPDRLAPAFVHIAETRAADFNGQRLNAWQIAQDLETSQ